MFRKIFPSLEWDATDLNLWTWPEDLHNFLVIRLLQVLEWRVPLLQEGAFHGDHRKLLELVIHFLSGQVSRPRKRGSPKIVFTMMKPGAFHHTCFMAKSLYLLKIAMLMHKFPPRFHGPEQQLGVHKMAQFIFALLVTSSKLPSRVLLHNCI